MSLDTEPTAMAPSVRTAASVGEWLLALQPPPPPALAARLADVLAPYLHEPADRVSTVCLEAGEQLLAALLASGSTSRVTALDLLSVDALVTYAFEAAADAPEELESRAARAMACIAALPNDRRD
ncbi:MAG: hypothetical protein KA154_14120 [Gemmatimonadaceae bacterium]|mgnify:FL=1|jgi:hypothetical protein|nr:hypothetical protein [Gemmatimonadaceae bacterium]MCC6432740.1 hypothetical protein [Gemmatimonadaceae bacterium]